MGVFGELKRRNVFRVAIAYIVASWVILQASALLLEIFGAPESIMRVIVVLLVLGFVISISFTWAFEVTPEGLKRESEVDRDSFATQQSAKRLDMLTIALVVVAIGVLVIDRYMQSDPVVADAGVPLSTDSGRAYDELAQQILEVDRKRDAGEYSEAFAIAAKIESLIQDESTREALWTGISWTSPIESEPPGARVFRQSLGAADNDWEDLGTTPLVDVRFALDQGYRLRFELSGYRPVEVLHSAVRDYRWGETRLDSRPIIMDPVDVLPEEMVRVPGFTHDLVDYADLFVDRFEVTNRDFAHFVTSGGYESPEYWQQPFLEDDAEISWDDAMAQFVDRTGRRGPATWTGGAYPDGQGDYPVNGVSWYEAAAYAAFVDKQLPTIMHFAATRKYDIVDAGHSRSRSNLGGSGPLPVGHGRAMNAFGVYDLDGNVREWCWNETGKGTRGTSGAAWTDAPFHTSWIIPKSSWNRDPTNGIRLIRTFDSAEKLARLRQPEAPPPRRDPRDIATPTREQIEIYQRLFDYDALPLNAKTVTIDEFEHWNREHIEFDLPYGERGGAYLYVPAHARPPYEAIVFWGGHHILELQSVDREFIEAFDFIIRSGRVVVQPILKGTFGRINEATRRALEEYWSDTDFQSGTAWRDLSVKWVQDVSRSLDYVESRDDIKSEAVGYYGLSWGGGIAPLLLANEDRIGPAVFNVGGLDDVWRDLPEVDPLTYVRLVKNPVLMLNGEYDIVKPMETSQKAMFELLGTDLEHKKHYVTPAGHVVPREDTVRETLDWYDRYLSGHGN